MWLVVQKGTPAKQLTWDFNQKNWNDGIEQNNKYPKKNIPEKHTVTQLWIIISLLNTTYMVNDKLIKYNKVFHTYFHISAMGY